jgi:hypothetical protein
MGQWESSQGASDEWYTPPYIFEALGETFDLDVAAPQQKTFVPARQCFTIIDDGLFGGRGSLGPWLTKFFDHGNGIALTPDRTSAPWFQEAWARADLALFMPKVRFIRPDGTTGNSPANGTCLWAAGDRACAALRRAAPSLGILAIPERLAA